MDLLDKFLFCSTLLQTLRSEKITSLHWEISQRIDDIFSKIIHFFFIIIQISIVNCQLI